MKTSLWLMIGLVTSFSVQAEICDFPTCIEWYENGQCAQTTCDPCQQFMCTDWYQNGQCFTGTCDPTCAQPQCHEWHQNGQCMHASC